MQDPPEGRTHRRISCLSEVNRWGSRGQREYRRDSPVKMQLSAPEWTHDLSLRESRTSEFPEFNLPHDRLRFRMSTAAQTGTRGIRRTPGVDTESEPSLVRTPTVG